MSSMKDPGRGGGGVEGLCPFLLPNDIRKDEGRKATLPSRSPQLRERTDCDERCCSSLKVDERKEGKEERVIGIEERKPPYSAKKETERTGGRAGGRVKAPGGIRFCHKTEKPQRVCVCVRVRERERQKELGAENERRPSNLAISTFQASPRCARARGSRRRRRRRRGSRFLTYSSHTPIDPLRCSTLVIGSEMLLNGFRFLPCSVCW